MRVNLSSDSSVPLEFKCPFCPCVFSSQVDLDLHLVAFDNIPHLAVWRFAHKQLEIDGHNVGVDDHDGFELRPFNLDKRISRYMRRSRFRRKVHR